MADISTELARILSAIYGEDVRGSIHDAIEKINNVSEVVLTTGTAVTSPSSSSTGFYDDSLYLNTDTFELWKCTGVNTWASQGILKGEAGDDGNGIVSIEKTSTSGLIDTYTITYTDGDTDTFTVTNGEDGANGNKWYRGTGISGKAALPTVYTGSGVADANSGDMFLNPSEGAVYSCVTGGIPTVATWQYEMTLSGGGGGTSDYPDLTNKPSINGHTLLGNQTGADLGLASSSDIPTVDQTYSATSSNAQSGKAVASAISGKADTSLLKSTVGWTGKNRAYLQTNNAVIAHIENGITYDVSWTGSATVTLKKNSTSGATITSGSTSPLSFTADADYELYFGSSATVTNIMVKDSRITDDTYEPYHESVEEEIEQIYADNGVLGAKNLLPLTLSGIKALNSSRTWNDNSCEHNGITFTVNVDDKGNVTSVSESGTATGFAFLRLVNVSSFSGSYILNKGISANKFVYIQNETTNVLIANSTGNDANVNLTPTNDLVNCIVGVQQGQTGDGTFYPMLRLASDPDDTYVPYAMTNKEITEELTAINNGLDDWTSTATVSSSGTVSFSGLNDSYGYKIYYTLPSGDSAYTFSKVTKSGSGTSVTLTYTTDAPSGTVCKLRILK